MEKYKELASSADVKVKWQQNKLKAEQDVLKVNDGCNAICITSNIVSDKFRNGLQNLCYYYYFLMFKLVFV